MYILASWDYICTFTGYPGLGISKWYRTGSEPVPIFLNRVDFR
ncbi:hypothetical protein HanXRQr2_Chr03g0116971 [Helianthus annuus]|uniref:Uncharacterized protein n=1 Tax=Helianthus annuus TaxID=4232 RepID=A0A9K3JGV7_HELAN|nr:hypothetical protein HanXRQr2_Chr03g0116971 [Helianthus annuus]KAJ0944193.1 hypothetical protein HanPSC8_Chr03g0113461 [Helianthus annuus]